VDSRKIEALREIIKRHNLKVIILSLKGMI